MLQVMICTGVYYVIVNFNANKINGYESKHVFWYAHLCAPDIIKEALPSHYGSQHEVAYISSIYKSTIIVLHIG